MTITEPVSGKPKEQQKWAEGQEGRSAGLLFLSFCFP